MSIFNLEVKSREHQLGSSVMFSELTVFLTFISFALKVAGCALSVFLQS